MQSPINKILIMQLRQFGDVLMTTPAIKQLRLNFKNAQIDFLTEKLGSKAIEHNSYINNIIIFPKKPSLTQQIDLISQLKASKYDLLVDYQSNPRTSLISYFVKPVISIGRNKGLRRFLYSKKVNDLNVYAAQSKLDFISSYCEVKLDPIIEMHIKDEHKKFATDFCKKHLIDRKTVAFCAVSRRDYKTLPVELMAEIVEEITSKGQNVFFVYGPGEYDQAFNVFNKLATETKTKCIINYEIPTLAQSFAIFNNCSMFIGNDGGLKHLAIANRLPTFTIYRNISGIWTPPNNDLFFDYQYIDNQIQNKDLLNKISSFIDKHCQSL